MKEIKYIFFDIGGVLYTLDYESVWNGFYEYCNKPLNDIQNVLYSEDIFVGFETGKITSYEYYRSVTERLDCSMSFNKFKRIWNSILLKRDHMFELILKLKDYVNILLLSNTNEINALAMKDDLSKITNNYVYSYEVGFMKPDRRIYEIALEKINVDPENIIFVDDREQNIEAAKHLRIHSYLYRNIGNISAYLEDYGICLSS